MKKLTEIERKAILTCIYYVAKKFECDRYKLEVKYDKLNHYDEELDKRIQNTKELEEFYANLGEKFKEILK